MGRASMIMVMSYSTVLMMMGFNISKVSNSAYENYIDYYERTVAHNIVNSGANLAAQQIYVQPNWRTGYSNKPMFGGTINAAVTTQSDSTLKLFVTAEYKTYRDTVIVVLQPSSFSKFSYYSNIEGNIWWTSKDTVWGPMHTQDYLGVANSPVFYGKVTSKKGLEIHSGGANPKFYGDFQSGVSLELPSDLNPLKSASASGGRYIYDNDVSIEFMDDSAKVKIGTSADTMVYLPTWAPNGAILVEKGNLRLKGTVNKSLTVGALEGGSSSKGKVYFDDDLKYKYDPLLYPDSTVVVGVVAEDSLVITQNSANQEDIIIQAALFSLTKGLGSENYNIGDPRGKIELLGGITQYQRAAVGTFSGESITHGYSKRYRYDERLMVLRPPFFPTTGSYEVLSWYER